MSSYQTKKNLAELIPDLKSDDCNIEAIDSGIRISFFDGQTFEIFEVGGWVQVGAMLLTEDELDDLTYREEVYQFLLLLNSRCLGCRFSLDPEGALLLVEDIPWVKATPEAILEAIDSISFVGYAFYEIIMETGRIGLPPTEGEIDSMVTNKESDYDRYH